MTLISSGKNPSTHHTRTAHARVPLLCLDMSTDSVCHPLSQVRDVKPRGNAAQASYVYIQKYLTKWVVWISLPSFPSSSEHLSSGDYLWVLDTISFRTKLLSFHSVSIVLNVKRSLSVDLLNRRGLKKRIIGVSCLLIMSIEAWSVIFTELRVESKP